jgi:hypothetical protein
VKVFTPHLTSRYSENFLTVVSASGPSDLWASGVEKNVNDENFRVPYVLHNTGSGWTLVQVPTIGEESSTLNSVTVPSPTDVWAVGQTQENDGSILTLSSSSRETPGPSGQALTLDHLARLWTAGLIASQVEELGTCWASAFKKHLVGAALSLNPWSARKR